MNNQSLITISREEVRAACRATIKGIKATRAEMRAAYRASLIGLRDWPKFWHRITAEEAEARTIAMETNPEYGYDFVYWLWIYGNQLGTAEKLLRSLDSTTQDIQLTLNDYNTIF